MYRFLSEAPDSMLTCSALSAALNLSGWEYEGRVEGHADGETIDLGRHKPRFLETPHVHHWDSMMLVEERTNSLFPSDLLIQPGDQPPVVTGMHGGSLWRDTIPHFVRSLREEPFAYQGKVLRRELPTVTNAAQP